MFFDRVLLLFDCNSLGNGDRQADISEARSLLSYLWFLNNLFLFMGK